METEILDDNNYNKIRNVEYATFLDRFLAALLDGLITTIPILGFTYLGYTNKSLLYLLLAGLVGLFYKPLMEGTWGATLGKMIMKIKMVDSDLDQIDLTQSLLKNAIYIIASVVGLLGHIWLTGTEEFDEAEGFLEVSAVAQTNPYQMINYIWIVIFLISCFAMFASNEKQTLHDRIANTFCVKNSTFDQH